MACLDNRFSVIVMGSKTYSSDVWGIDFQIDYTDSNIKDAV